MYFSESDNLGFYFATISGKFKISYKGSHHHKSFFKLKSNIISELLKYSVIIDLHIDIAIFVNLFFFSVLVINL